MYFKRTYIQTFFLFFTAVIDKRNIWISHGTYFDLIKVPHVDFGIKRYQIAIDSLVFGRIFLKKFPDTLTVRMRFCFFGAFLLALHSLLESMMESQ